MVEPRNILDRMVRKFGRCAHLDDSDRKALRGLPYDLKVMEAGRYIVREGSSPDHSAVLVSGLAYRHKITAEGARQIVSIHVAGDFVDLEGSLLSVVDHNIQALTRSEVALIRSSSLLELANKHPRIARAMWIDTIIDGSIFREWVVNVGRRDARERLAHLMCEFARRLEAAGMGSPDGYELPMTQEQLGDATGLTSVHVNRTLKSLADDGLISRERRFIRIPDWEKMRAIAGFNETYLHLDQVGGASPR